MDSTAIMIVVVAAIVIIWDIVVYVQGKKTVSQHIQRWAKLSLPVAFLAGFICGHFFWPLCVGG